MLTNMASDAMVTLNKGDLLGMVAVVIFPGLVVVPMIIVMLVAMGVSGEYSLPNWVVLAVLLASGVAAGYGVWWSAHWFTGDAA
jgi:hypothetical protein